VVLIERHNPGWAQTATDLRIELDALVLGLSDVRRHLPFVSEIDLGAQVASAHTLHVACWMM
jgi:hypothetical protein